MNSEVPGTLQSYVVLGQADKQLHRIKATKIRNSRRREIHYNASIKFSL